MSSGSNITPSVMPSHPPQREKSAHDSDTQAVPGSNRVVPPVSMTGAQAIVRSLEELDVTDVFGLPGGAILPTYDPLMDTSRIRHILVRHEQGAGHAAQGYYLATGKTGVAIATSGPGATNLVTAIADANMDSEAVVFITGQVGSNLIGSDAFQEADIVGITMPITTHSFLVRRAEDVPQALAEAFYIANTGRPGPVLVDVTKDAQESSMEFSWPPTMDLPGYRPVTRGHSRQVREAAKLIQDAKRPVLYVGGGTVRAQAAEELAELAQVTVAPLVTTLNARGVFPDNDPHNLGMPGMHGTVAAVSALQMSDLLITLGARFDERVTGQLASFAPMAKVIHADIDPAEISKNRTADVPIVGYLKNILPELTEQVRLSFSEHGTPDLSGWWSVVHRTRETYPLGYAPTDDGLMAPQKVLETLSEIAGPEAMYVAGVGQPQMWGAQFVEYQRPKQWMNSAGLGTMGFAIPAAMGAQVAEPDRAVWAIDGDGCFQMTNQELATCTINNIPIKVALINNSPLGMVRQWQTLFYDSRYSHTDLNTGADTIRVPDFVKLAEAYGAVGIRVEQEEDIAPAIEKAMEINDRPVVIDFVVSADSMVWPMVPAGVSNDQIQVARDMTPEWDEEA